MAGYPLCLALAWLRLDPGFCSPTRTANLSIVPHSANTGQRRNDHSHPTPRVTDRFPPQVGCALPCDLRGKRICGAAVAKRRMPPNAALPRLAGDLIRLETDEPPNSSVLLIERLGGRTFASCRTKSCEVGKCSAQSPVEHEAGLLGLSVQCPEEYAIGIEDHLADYEPACRFQNPANFLQR